MQERSVDEADGHLKDPHRDYLTPRFKILRLLGQGTYGKVVEVFDHRDQRTVAVKVIKAIPKYREAAKTELKILNLIKQHDQSNAMRCIHLLETFEFENHICMVFELLSQSLFDFFKANAFAPFPIDHIRSFSRQLIQAVAYLHDLGIIHTDLKPENLMLKANASYTATYRSGSHHSTRRELRDTSLMLIDFGSAICETDYHSSVVSTRHYRAPEIILGMPWSYPCDVWSIGCILVELYIGAALFQTHDNLEHLRMMEIVLGEFPRSFLSRMGETGRQFFGHGRVLFPGDTVDTKSMDFVNRMKPLSSMVMASIDDAHREFLDMVTRMLQYDPGSRLSAREALHHPFLRQP